MEDEVSQGRAFTFEPLPWFEVQQEHFFEGRVKRELAKIKDRCEKILTNSLKIDISLLSEETFSAQFKEKILLHNILQNISNSYESEPIMRAWQTPSFGNAEFAKLISHETTLAFHTLDKLYEIEQIMREESPHLRLYEILCAFFDMVQFYRFTDFDQYIEDVQKHAQNKAGGSRGGKKKHANEAAIKKSIDIEIKRLALELYQKGIQDKGTVAIHIKEEWHNSESELYKLRKDPYSIEVIEKHFKLRELKAFPKKNASS